MARSLGERLRDLIRFRGRIGVLAYWKAQVLLMIVMAVTMVVGYSAIIAIGPFGAVLLTPFLGVLVGSAGIVVRRLHDRGKSAWWIALFVVAPVLMSGWIREGDPSGTSLTTLLVALATLALEIWGFVEIGFLRGTVGANRYGLDPMQPTPQEVFA